MAVKQVRNKNLLPLLDDEGVFSKPIHLSAKEKHGCSVFSRLYSHHTLASVRRMGIYHPFFVPKDSFDFKLNSVYNQTSEPFPDKADVCMQPETRECRTGRRMRNTYDRLLPQPVPLGHPMKRGGIKERQSPYSVKLMNSGVHSAQTNPGFSRQPAGGAIFFY